MGGVRGSSGEEDVGDVNRCPLADDLLQGQDQVERPVGRLEVVDRPSDVGRLDAQQTSGLLVGSDHDPIGVQDELRQWGGLEDQAAGHRPQRSPGEVSVRREPEPGPRVVTGDLAEDPPLQVDGCEGLLFGEQHLRLAEQQVAVVVQSEMEVVEDLGLGLGVQVHQRVAAGQQVDPGDGSVGHEVVPAEDDRAAELLVEDKLVPGRDWLEIPGSEVLGNPLHLGPGVRRRPRLGQGLLVDVGGVDLHVVDEGLPPQPLGKQHRDGVGLLPRGAPGTPDAHLPLLGTLREGRDDRLGDVLPDLGIPEEGGDVDEHEIEELPEFLGVDLEVVLVLGEALDAEHVHALVDPGHQARGLVAGEVEATGAPQVFEQLEKPRFGRRRCHEVPSGRAGS